MNRRKHEDTPTGEELPEEPSHGFAIPDEHAIEQDGAIGAILPDTDEEEGDE